MSVQAITTEFLLGGTCDACGCSRDNLTVMRITSGVAASQWLCLQCELQGIAFDLSSIQRRPVTKQMKRASVRQERKIAKGIGGQRQKGSGAMAHAKGDVRKHGVFRVEAKFTQAGSYPVRLRDLNKIRSECAGQEVPAFQITFMDQRIQPIDEWVLIPYAVWRRYAAAEDRGP